MKPVATLAMVLCLADLRVVVSARYFLIRKYLVLLTKNRHHSVISQPNFMISFANDSQEAAAVLAAGLEDWIDFGVICALLLLNACVGFIQEFQA